MAFYNLEELKAYITDENIFDLLKEWGGEPRYTNFGILSATICHNEPGVGSHKLYFYNNSRLFKCYTGCGEDYFDLFELVRKVAAIQWHTSFEFQDAVRWIANRLGFYGSVSVEKSNLEDWKVFERYNRAQEFIEDKTNVQNNIILPAFDKNILKCFNYKVELTPWIKEGISKEILRENMIGYYPTNNQITIPHYDINGNLVGIRGRTLSKEDAELYGKYRPLRFNRKMYNHPLGFNLYNLNNSKDNIEKYRKVIVFESEKSTLKYQSYFGRDNDISVACCGSNLSSYQVNLLLKLNVEEIIVAFDRQFQEQGDDEWKHLTNNLKKIHSKYSNQTNVSFIFDKNMITDYKDAPIDKTPDIFVKLFKDRVKL